MHTPGPYELYSEGRTIIVGDVTTHTDLAEFFYCDEATVKTSREEAEANARLFMAAPDMLAALEAIPFPSTMGSPREHYGRFYAWYHNIAEPAIKRARGQS